MRAIVFRPTLCLGSCCWFIAVTRDRKTPVLKIPVLEAFIFATVLFGFLGIIAKKNLLMKIIAMDVMSTGVIAYYVLVAARQGVFTPILADDPAGAYADPVPQAVILTAIVIGFSIQALMLVGAMKLARENPTLETSEIERGNQP